MFTCTQPVAGTQGRVVSAASLQRVENSFGIGGDVEVIADCAADQGQEVSRAFTGGDAAEEQPILTAMARSESFAT